MYTSFAFKTAEYKLPYLYSKKVFKILHLVKIKGHKIKCIVKYIVVSNLFSYEML